MRVPIRSSRMVPSHLGQSIDNLPYLAFGYHASIFYTRAVRTLGRVLGAAALMAGGVILARETPPPLSSFRKYFWGARTAYEQRNFKKAQRLLQTYRDLGSPSDRLLVQAGCDPKQEVALFSAALKDVRACIAGRSQSLFWTDSERAKLDILLAMRDGNPAELEPYVDCAPVDLTIPPTSCGVHQYPKPPDLERLAAALRKTPDILKQPNWRGFPVDPHDPLRVTWVLYTYSDHWKPCAMEGAPIISLRQDTAGQIRIAGLAASCLEF